MKFAPLLRLFDELDDLQQVLVGHLPVTHRACAPAISRGDRYPPRPPASATDANTSVSPRSSGISRDAARSGTARRGGRARAARASPSSPAPSSAPRPAPAQP